MAERKKTGERNCAKTVKFLKPQMERARLLDKDASAPGIFGELRPVLPHSNADGDQEKIQVKGIIREYADSRNIRLASRQAAPPLLLPDDAVSPDGLLRGLSSPMDLHFMSVEQLAQLAGDVRRLIIETVARNGGHLAPSLGVVELTLAILSVFSPPKDKVVWDVGHQSYAWKILTDRAESFHTLRTLGGISGFPRPEESAYDAFGVGHSSTSISAALGMAVARDRAGNKNHVVSVIGDGALTAGQAYEAMNHAGSIDRPFIVILNDNEMSIAKNVGALSLFMSRNLSSRWVRLVKRELEAFLRSIPGIGDDLFSIARRSRDSFKNFFTPGLLFEALRFNYIGPVNGHDIDEMQQVLRLAATLEKPVLVHMLTKKGQGYPQAEQNPTRFHGVGRFDSVTGQADVDEASPANYTAVFGRALCDLAREDKRIMAITAAMPEGTGLNRFAAAFPDRFFDVGICEPHAVTFAAGLATQGLRPVVAIYSTFMQRAYDQILHDVCIQKLPVIFCLDRAGVVGEDGATHQGAFDIAYLRSIPNLAVFAPKDEDELRHGLCTALSLDMPVALRWPRGPGVGADISGPFRVIPLGEAEYLSRGDSGLAVLALGNRVYPALEAAKRFADDMGKGVTVVNARWVKPLPFETIKELAQTHDKVLIVEEGSLAGGFSSSVLEYLSDAGLLARCRVKRSGMPDRFVEHGAADVLRRCLGLDADGIVSALMQMLAE